MIGKLISVPFRFVGGSVGLIGNILKLILIITFGILKLLFKNSLGVIIGIIGGFFIAKKSLESECTCGSSEEPAE